MKKFFTLLIILGFIVCNTNFYGQTTWLTNNIDWGYRTDLNYSQLNYQPDLSYRGVDNVINSEAGLFNSWVVGENNDVWYLEASWYYDFQEIKTLNAFKIYSKYEWPYSTLEYIRLYVSDNPDGPWTLALDQTLTEGFPENWYSYNFPEKTGRYWKVTGKPRHKAFDIKEIGFGEVYNESMIAYYPFNGNANDESGYGNHGTVNGATLTTDRFGNANRAYSFERNNIDYIQIGNSLSLTPGLYDYYTVSFWFNSSTPSLSGQRMIQVIDYEYNNISNYDIELSETGHTNKFCVLNYPHVPPVCSPEDITSGNWYHCILEFDHISNTVKAYKNGVTWFNGPISDIHLTTTSNVFFGNSAGIHIEHGFNGKLDDIKIFKRALTESEILDLYNEGAPQIATQPVDQNVCSGDSISLIVGSDAGVNYQWQKNNENIVGATDSIYTIMQVQDTDAGDYTCVVSNTFNSTISNTAVLYVRPSYSLSETVSVCSGDSYIFPDGTTQNNITAQVIYTSNLQTVLGCDSIIETTVNVNPVYDLNETVSICSGESYTFPDGTSQNNITSQVIHTSYLQTTLGCDSIIETTVNVYQLDISLTKTDAGCNNPTGTAIANVTGDNAPFNYLWSNGSTDYYANNLNAGSHFVQVTDNLGCFADRFFTISSSEGPEIALQGLTDIQCNGGNTGAININVTGGTQPYVYEWSTGHSTQDISNLAAGLYSVTVTDAVGCVTTDEYEIDQADALVVNMEIVNPTCSGSEGQITAGVSGGTAPYGYLWNTGATMAQITGLMAGTYNLTVTDDAGCSSFKTVNLSNTEAPEIVLESVTPTSCGTAVGGIDVTITGGATPYASIDWSNGTHEEDLTGVGAGTYTLTVTDNNACISSLTAEVLSETISLQPICMVTVDSLSGRNLIIWEKAVTEDIDHYNIYRESSYAGQYNLIAQVDYNSASEYIDLDANPATRSWRYKLSAADVCGNESDLSDFHKTIHLTMNEGLNKTVNLIWDYYQGFEYGTFHIYRYLNSEGWILLDELPANLTSYTDDPPSMGRLYYKITVNPETSCVNKKSGNYNESASNMRVYEVSTGIEDNAVNKTITVYPNPSDGIIKITGSYIQKVEVMNIHGQVIERQEVNFNETEMNLSRLAKGVYFLKVQCEGFTVNKKLILR